jgi:dihydroflavonol-4-reductase
MDIAITGATGHVGANLCRILIGRGHKVRALAVNGLDSIKGLDLEIYKGNVLDPDSLDQLMKGADAMVHLAAIVSIKSHDRGEVAKVNVEGTKNVLECAKKHGLKKLIHFSSIHALDNSPRMEPMNESKPLVSRSPLPYETTKSKAESLVRAAMDEGQNVIIFNPTSIIGPNDFKPSLMGQVIIKLYRKQIPALVRGGYDWVDVRDIGEAVANALERNIDKGRYLLSGRWIDLKTLSKLMAEATGRRTPQTVLPVWVARVGVPFMAVEAWLRRSDPLYTNPVLNIIESGNRMISSARAREELDFNPRPLKETVADTINWFKENNYL